MPFDSDICLSALLLFYLVLLTPFFSPFFLLLAQCTAYFAEMTSSFLLLEIGYFFVLSAFLAEFLRLGDVGWSVISVI